jgi:hypothetical protein
MHGMMLANKEGEEVDLLLSCIVEANSRTDVVGTHKTHCCIEIKPSLLFTCGASEGQLKQGISLGSMF